MNDRTSTGCNCQHPSTDIRASITTSGVINHISRWCTGVGHQTNGARLANRIIRGKDKARADCAICNCASLSNASARTCGTVHGSHSNIATP